MISGDEMHTDSSALAVLGEQLMMNKRLLSTNKRHPKCTVRLFQLKRVRHSYQLDCYQMQMSAARQENVIRLYST